MVKSGHFNKSEPQNVKGSWKWQRAAMHPRAMLIVSIVVVAALIVGAQVLIFRHNHGEKFAIATGNGYEKGIGALLRRPVPTQPLEQMYYYSQLGQNYEALGKYSQSLDYYLKAQEVADKNNLGDRAAFYSAISDSYAHLGNKDRADEYRKKADQYLKRPHANVPDTINAQKDQ